MAENKKELIFDELIDAAYEFIRTCTKYSLSKEYADLRNKYYGGELWNVSNYKHKAITTSSINLLKMVIANSGTKEEIGRAIKHFYICLDSEKHKLDYKRFRKDYGIYELNNKYNDRKLV